MKTQFKGGTRQISPRPVKSPLCGVRRGRNLTGRAPLRQAPFGSTQGLRQDRLFVKEGQERTCVRFPLCKNGGVKKSSIGVHHPYPNPPPSEGEGMTGCPTFLPLPLREGIKGRGKQESFGIFVIFSTPTLTHPRQRGREYYLPTQFEKEPKVLPPSPPVGEGRGEGD